MLLHEIYFWPQLWVDAAATKQHFKQVKRGLTRIFLAFRFGKASTAFCWDVPTQFWWFLTSIQNTPQLKEAFLIWAPRLTPCCPFLILISHIYSWEIILPWWGNGIQTLLGIGWISISFKDGDENGERGWCDSEITSVLQSLCWIITPHHSSISSFLLLLHQ